MENGQVTNFEALLQQIFAKADACKTAEEAEELYDREPRGSDAERIYMARWVELAKAEAIAKAAACKTEEEAEELYNNAPAESDAERIYEARWMELHVAGQ